MHMKTDGKRIVNGSFTFCLLGPICVLVLCAYMYIRHVHNNVQMEQCCSYVLQLNQYYVIHNDVSDSLVFMSV